MAITPKNASLVSARDLPSLVDKAIQAAGIRVASNGPVVIRWDLAGKVVRNFAEGQQFAEAVSKHISADGIKAVPAILQIDKKILAGFFERAALPQMRNL